MKIIVTAGPTREYIDDVRPFSNASIASSGRMGYAAATAAAAAGHEVALRCLALRCSVLRCSAIDVTPAATVDCRY